MTNAPPDLLAVDVRKIGKISDLKGFKGKGWKQTCDYLLIFQDDRNVRALLIDLKKTLGKNKWKGFAQLQQSRPLLDYLWSIYEIWYYRVRNEARPDCFQISAGYALISEQIHESFKSLNKQFVNLESGETTSERYKNIDICITVNDVVSWKKLLRIKETNGER